MKIIITNIKWDLSHEVDNETTNYDMVLKDYNLPIQTTLEVDDDLEDDEVEEIVSDFLSDTYGFCHNGFEWCFENR